MSITPLSRLISSLAQQFNNTDDDAFADVIIECDYGRKQFRAHRFILSLNTAEFERLIALDSINLALPSGKLPIVRFNDVSATTMKRVLELLYGGDGSMSSEDAVKLLPLTRQLRVDVAERLCRDKILIGQMSDDNVFTFLQIGMMQGMEMLCQAAIEFLCVKGQATSVDVIDHRQVIRNTERSVVARLVDAVKVIGKQEGMPAEASSDFNVY